MLDKRFFLQPVFLTMDLPTLKVEEKQVAYEIAALELSLAEKKDY